VHLSVVLPFARRENASASLVTMATIAVVAVTVVTMATVAKAGVTVVKEKRVTLSPERVLRIVLLAGSDRTVTEVRFGQNVQFKTKKNEKLALRCGLLSNFFDQLLIKEV